MKDFYSLAKERYSCKQYDGRQVDATVLEQILEAGRLAPTAKNLQEQKIYVLQSEQALAIFDEATPCRYQAPTVLIVAYDKTNVYTYPGEERDSGIEDATIVATHLMLAAADLGVDSCWVNRLDPKELAKALDLPDNEEIVMALDLGYHAENGVPLANHMSRKPLTETVVYR